ncbi:hypothetical protein FRB99_002356 [Tulasnella sp. 403]|nr:hypothetical protein FRB99_002356 [Tulasnella sp. 403]
MYAGLFLNCSDGPARAKVNGTASCNCNDHMCAECLATFVSLTEPSAYDPALFQRRNPYSQAFWKLVAKNSTTKNRDLIFNRRGVRYSVLDELPNWLAAKRSPGEPMHVVVLGDTAFIHKDIICALGMFNPH